MKPAHLFLLVIWFLAGCAQSPATQTATLSNTPTTAPSPTKTSTVTSTSTPTVTLTPSPAPTLRLPVTLATPMPLPQEPITAQTIQNISRLATWGQGAVKDVAVSVDGSLLAAGSTSGVAVYDAHTLEQIQFFSTQTPIIVVAFSPNGAIIAAGDFYNRILLLRTSNGEVLGELIGEPGEPVGLSFSADGNFLLSNRYFRREYQSILWDLQTSQARLALPQNYQFDQVTFSPDGSHLAACNPEENQVQILDLSNLEPVVEFQVFDCSHTTYSPDGKILAVTSGTIIRLHQAQDGAYLDALSGERVQFAPSGNYLLTTTYTSLTVWEKDPATAKYSLKSTWKTVNGLQSAFSPDGTLIAFETDNGMTVIQAGDGAVIATYPSITIDDLNAIFFRDEPIAHTDYSYTPNFWFSADGKTLAHVSMYLYEVALFVRLTEISSGKTINELEFPHGVMASQAIQFSPDDSLLASNETFDCQGDCTEVYLYKSVSGELLDRFKIEFMSDQLTLGKLIFSPDGSQMIIRSRFIGPGDGQLWQLSPPKNLEQRALLFFPDGTVLDNPQALYMAISPDGSLVIDEGQQSVKVLRTSDLETQATIMMESIYGGEDWQFSPDGKSLAISVVQKYVGVWNAQTGALIRTLPQGEKIAYSPDGSLLAVSGWDPWIHKGGTVVNFYQASDGALLYTLKFPSRIGDISFSNDGTRFAICGGGNISIWAIKP